MTALLLGLRSLASFTDSWCLYKEYYGNYEQTIIELHQGYGDIVRIDPTIVSIADPTTIESIYGLMANFDNKLYNRFVQMNKGKSVEWVFTNPNTPWHSAIKRPVSQASFMTTLTDHEPHANKFINQLIEQLIAGYCSDTDQVEVCPMAL
ncbi:hypothetical protein ACHAPA_005941 [Fusarium lateritium]